MISEESRQTGRKEILVVDDNPESLRLLTRILTDHGYRARPASNGILALRSVEARSPDLILLDVKMPEMGGFELCRRLKSSEQSRDIPVLFISAVGETAEKVRGFEAGGVDYIAKPFEPGEVLSRVGIHLRMRELTANLQDAKESLEKRVEERTRELAALNRQFGAEISERRQIERSLRESEERFKAAFEKAATGKCLVGIDGRFIKVNPALSDMLGYSELELVSRDFVSLTHPDDASMNQEIVSSLIRGDKETARFEKRYIHKSGRTVWVNLNTCLVRDPDGRPLYFITDIQDITDRKAAEEALQLTRFSVDHAATAAHLIDKNARLLYVNDETCRSLGYSREELLGMSIPDIDPDMTQAKWQQAWAALRRSGSLRLETRHRRKDGSIFPVEVTANYVEFSGREYDWAFALDISARKEAEEAVERSYKLTKTIIDNMNDAVALIDVPTLRIAGVNRVFLEDYRFADEAEVIGKTCHEVTHRRPEACALSGDACPLLEMLRTGEHATAEHMHYGKNGEKLYFEIATSPIRDESGTIVQVVHVARNITDRRRAETALRESERFLDTIIENAPVCVKLLAEDGTLLRMNRAGLEMLGADSLEQVRGKCIYPVVVREHRQTFKDISKAVFKGGSGMLEFEIVNLKGERLWLRTYAVPLYNDERKINALLGITLDITEQKRMEEKVRHQAFHDALTDLPNRLLFIDMVNFELARSKRTREKCAVLFLDLDKFKYVNDTLGHAVGDKLLQEVAERLRRVLRESDAVARIGGDEFNILLRGVDHRDSVAGIAAKVIDAFNRPCMINGRRLPAAASIGISIYPDDAPDAETLFKNADVAMYHAKEAGGNTYRFFNPSMDLRTLRLTA